MNTEVIIIIVVAVLVLLGVVAVLVLKKEKFSTTQQLTAHGVIGATISNINFYINVIKNIEYDYLMENKYPKPQLQAEIESFTKNALSDALYITALYVSFNIDAINKHIAANKASSALTQDNYLFKNSFQEIHEIAKNGPAHQESKKDLEDLYMWALVPISNNLFIIYFNIRLYEENNNAKFNTEHIRKLYKDFLTIFPNFPILLEIIKPMQVGLLEKLTPVYVAM